MWKLWFNLRNFYVGKTGCYIMARTLKHVYEDPLPGMRSSRDASWPLLRAGNYRIVEGRNLNSTAAVRRSHIYFGHRICGQCFCMFGFLSLFIFIFIIPFLPGSPFRVFNPPGNSSFVAPVFAWIAFWRLSTHRGAHSCLSRPFRFST